MSETSNVTPWPQEEETNHSLRGLFGALLGALIGAVLFAIVFHIGFVTSLVGLVIVFLAGWMYEKFGGKPGVMQFVAMLAALIIGVTVGLIGGYSLDFLKDYEADDPGMSRFDYVCVLWEQNALCDQETSLGKVYDREVADLSPIQRGFVVSRDEFIKQHYTAQWDENIQTFRGNFIKNWLMGLGFGLLGCFGALGSSLKGKKG